MLRPGRARELLVALFFLGALAFAPPLLIIFNKATRILGIPALYLYLFVVWTALIALVALAVERRPADDETDPEMPGQEGGQVTGGPSDA